jgi:1-pyrroline-5-carboxylate dehydrogenase
MVNAIIKLPYPENEPVYDYVAGSREAEKLSEELAGQSKNPLEIPLIIGGKEVKTGILGELHSPHNHGLLLGTYHKATKETIAAAIDSAMTARKKWMNMPWQSRAAIFLKAADLLATKYRPILNAATMLGQSKTAQQAEIDSACELIDFFRFNVHYMRKIYSIQPEHNNEHVWNYVEYRPLEGFVFALSPFNFTSIGGNLPTAPAVMGNVVVWKPASAAVLSNYYIMRLLKEAGMPDGVINFVPGDGAQVGDPVIDSRHFAGVHFTGSTGTFNSLWLKIAENIKKNTYKVYPRIVGETGGKDFLFAHRDCNIKAMSEALFCGAFEYQGQKCSATSRAYIPRSIWPQVSGLLKDRCSRAKLGDTSDLSVFMGAVIDEKAFKKIVSYIELAKASPGEYRIISGASYDSSKGWFIEPTIIETTNPKSRLMEEEIFGPVLTVYVYDDDKLDETLELLDSTSPFALTGSIFANDRGVIERLTAALCETAGNFYINDKSTGAVVGQQPFGGARASGTNDKAGSELNLMRWVSMRSIKENFSPPEV